MNGEDDINFKHALLGPANMYNKCLFLAIFEVLGHYLTDFLGPERLKFRFWFGPTPCMCFNNSSRNHSLMNSPSLGCQIWPEYWVAVNEVKIRYHNMDIS